MEKEINGQSPCFKVFQLDFISRSKRKLANKKQPAPEVGSLACAKLCGGCQGEHRPFIVVVRGLAQH